MEGCLVVCTCLSNTNKLNPESTEAYFLGAFVFVSREGKEALSVTLNIACFAPMTNSTSLEGCNWKAGRDKVNQHLNGLGVGLKVRLLIKVCI